MATISPSTEKARILGGLNGVALAAPPPRILVMSASVGSGHMTAAEAVVAALHQLAPQAHIRLVDILQLTNRFFRRFYGTFYLDLVNKAPQVYAYFYDMLNRPSRSGRNRGDRLRLFLEKLNLWPFIRFITSEPWDLVINTHFLPAEIIANLRKNKQLALPQVTVTTDFDTHRMWVNQPCERYFTATAEGAVYLQSWGVPACDTVVTGIPVHPVFSVPRDRGTLLARHGLAGDRPIVLQLAGGFGVGPIEQLHHELLKVEIPLDVVVISGRNEKLRQQLEGVADTGPHRAKIVGYTKQMDEFMALADLVISKPGGLSTAEALARGAVMVVVNPIPGQESRNSDFLLENGAAIKVNNIATLAFKVTELLRAPQRLAQLRANVRRVARPRAVFDIVEQSLQFVRKRYGIA
jgi:processive 1,2-diacylglycerol beta-glucosyltransferase